MEKLKEINSLIDKAYWQASLYYIGIFYRDTELISKTSSRSRNLPSYFGRFIERSLELNDILPNFREEFLFSEGKDYSLFVYYINKDLSIGMIHIGKPNFSLLKVTVSDLVKSLEPFISYLAELYAQKSTQQQDEETAKIHKSLGNTTISNNYINLEDGVKFENQTNIDVSSDKLNLGEEEKRVSDEELNFELPSLEDLFHKEMVEELSKNSPEEEGTVKNFEELVEKISLEFVREIGPFGKFLFKKKKDDFFKEVKKVTKFDLLKFIDLLSEEITVQQRKEEFLKRVKSHFVNL